MIGVRPPGAPGHINYSLGRHLRSYHPALEHPLRSKALPPFLLPLQYSPLFLVQFTPNTARPCWDGGRLCHRASPFLACTGTRTNAYVVGVHERR
jgi:hypothetical protein